MNKEEIAAKMIAIFGEDWEESPGWGWIQHRELPYLSIKYNESTGDYIAHVHKKENYEWKDKTKNPKRLLAHLMDVIKNDIEEYKYILENIKKTKDKSDES